MKGFVLFFLTLLALVAIKATEAEEKRVITALRSTPKCKCKPGEKNCKCLPKITKAEKKTIKKRAHPVKIMKKDLVKKLAEVGKIAKIESDNLIKVNKQITKGKLDLNKSKNKIVKMVKMARKVKAHLVAAESEVNILKNVIASMDKPVMVISKKSVQKFVLESEKKALAERKKLIKHKADAKILENLIKCSPKKKQKVLISKLEAVYAKAAVCKGKILAQKHLNKIMMNKPPVKKQNH